jgi:hypothetical protein
MRGGCPMLPAKVKGELIQSVTAQRLLSATNVAHHSRKPLKKGRNPAILLFKTIKRCMRSIVPQHLETTPH